MSSDDKKIDTKFDYLVSEVTKSHKSDEILFNEFDRVLQTKFQSFLSKLKSKIENNCKPEIEKLQVFTEYNKEVFNEISPTMSLMDLKPSKGYEKDFEESINKLKECASRITFLESDLYINSQIVTDLTTYSHEVCLEECRNDLKKYKHSENEVKKCLDACLRYRKFNMEAYYKIMIEGIIKKEITLEKI